jgi:hypothetical protein
MTQHSVTVEELLEREVIHDVLKRLARGTDRIDLDIFLSCYHPDAVEEHGHFQGPAREFAEFVCGDRSGRFAGTTHLIGAPAITVDGNRAIADTPCVAHCITVPDEQGQQHDFVSGVRYIDTVTRRDGGPWKIEKRVCLLDWTYTVPISAGILTGMTPGYSGHRDRSDTWYALTDPLADLAISR